MLRRALTLAGYDVRLAEDGLDGLAEVNGSAPDAVVLDIGMPGIDGLEVCRRLRAQGNRVPILMLTARDAVADRIDGLDAGADDYLVKPFDVDELKARLRALVRRATGEGDPDALSFGELRLDRGRHGVQVDGELRRAHPDRVPAARAAHAQPQPGAAAQPDLRPRVGLRLRPRLQRAAGLHRLPAAQARGRRGARRSSTPCAASGYILREP